MQRYEIVNGVVEVDGVLSGAADTAEEGKETEGTLYCFSVCILVVYSFSSRESCI